MKRKMILGVVLLTVLTNAFADIIVSDVEVFSGYPWKEVVVGYTITGTDTDTEAEADVIQLTAADKSLNTTYTAQSLTGAVLTEGRHVLRWNAASEGAKFSSSNVVFSVSIVRQGVRLWANGPYWAECNVGATTPEECGYYFWWGDTIGYKRNASDNGWVSVLNGESFSFNESNCRTIWKDNLKLKSDGHIDSTGNLVAKCDAATRHLGSRWRMPTDAECSALISNCTTTRTTLNGVVGLIVTGKGAYATRSIFLPAAGYGSGSSFGELGLYGRYWTSTPVSSYSGAAHNLYFFSGINTTGELRYLGFTVRPVRGIAQ